eukprot:56881-Chlamydomonas_euryale.AAC.1
MGAPLVRMGAPWEGHTLARGQSQSQDGREWSRIRSTLAQRSNQKTARPAPRNEAGMGTLSATNLHCMPFHP